MQKDEMTELKKAIKREKDEEELERLKYARSVMESRQRAEHELDLRRQVKTEHNREQRLRAEQGKSTYFLKDHEIDKRVKIKKFEELQKRGNIDRILAKKRKRVASKERKSTPFKRRKLEETQDGSE
jgi:ribosomal RNA-processing protein 36